MGTRCAVAGSSDGGPWVMLIRPQVMLNLLTICSNPWAPVHPISIYEVHEPFTPNSKCLSPKPWPLEPQTPNSRNFSTTYAVSFELWRSPTILQSQMYMRVTQARIFNLGIACPYKDPSIRIIPTMHWAPDSVKIPTLGDLGLQGLQCI